MYNLTIDEMFNHGECDGLSWGQHVDKVVTVLGPPCTDGGTSRKYQKPSILLYRTCFGNVQIFLCRTTRQVEGLGVYCAEDRSKIEDLSVSWGRIKIGSQNQLVSGLPSLGAAQTVFENADGQGNELFGVMGTKTQASFCSTGIPRLLLNKL